MNPTEPVTKPISFAGLRKIVSANADLARTYLEKFQTASVTALEKTNYRASGESGRGMQDKAIVAGAVAVAAGVATLAGAPMTIGAMLAYGSYKVFGTKLVENFLAERARERAQQAQWQLGMTETTATPTPAHLAAVAARQNNVQPEDLVILHRASAEGHSIHDSSCSNPATLSADEVSGMDSEQLQGRRHDRPRGG